MADLELYLQSLLAGAPFLISQLAAAAALLMAAVFVYERITPYREIRLIRDRNLAAAVTLAGFIIGMAIALASTMAHSVSLLDVLVWGVAAVVLQFLSFGVVAITHRDFSAAIVDGNAAAAVFLAACHIAAGLLVAAAVST